MQAVTEVLNKSHFHNSHLQMRQNPVTVAEHSWLNFEGRYYSRYICLFCCRMLKPQFCHCEVAGESDWGGQYVSWCCDDAPHGEHIINGLFYCGVICSRALTLKRAIQKWNFELNYTFLWKNNHQSIFRGKIISIENIKKCLENLVALQFFFKVIFRCPTYPGASSVSNHFFLISEIYQIDTN